ncbi:MAG TPA: hypothetical protein VEW42_02905 [Candidatus Eisenbacteria bacterium]|nr:hypothetical protein [Candidatus Eisenbacteria bacterium]
MAGKGKKERWIPLAVLGAGIGTAAGALANALRRRQKGHQPESQRPLPAQPQSPRIVGYRHYNPTEDRDRN